MKQKPTKGGGWRKLIGYNCKVCRGKKIMETEYALIHVCGGVLEPVFSSNPRKKA